jgi:hypothetical protein
MTGRAGAEWADAAALIAAEAMSAAAPMAATAMEALAVMAAAGRLALRRLSGWFLGTATPSISDLGGG